MKTRRRPKKPTIRPTGRCVLKQRNGDAGTANGMKAAFPRAPGTKTNGLAKHCLKRSPWKWVPPTTAASAMGKPCRTVTLASVVSHSGRGSSLSRSHRILARPRRPRYPPGRKQPQSPLSGSEFFSSTSASRRKVCASG
jgi:hypothetical protein